MFSKNIAITDTTDGLPNPRRIWAVIAASLALIMSVLDANIVNVVLPTLSCIRDFPIDHDLGDECLSAGYYGVLIVLLFTRRYLRLS